MERTRARTLQWHCFKVKTSGYRCLLNAVKSTNKTEMNTNTGNKWTVAKWERVVGLGEGTKKHTLPVMKTVTRM